MAGLGERAPASCHQTKDGILEPSSEGWRKSGMGSLTGVLDAQYHHLAQRRERVFVVANSEGWQRAAAVLFERHSLSGNPAPSRKRGKKLPEQLANALLMVAPAAPEGAAGNHFIPIGGIDCENNGHGMDKATGPLMKGSPTGGGKPLPAMISQPTFGGHFSCHPINTDCNQA